MNTAAVVLNYNDAGETLRAAERIRNIGCVDHVLVVDNSSTDGSADVISAGLGGCADDTALVVNDRNGGYGYGNNTGVRYAADVWGADAVIIANPDAVFDEEAARAMLKILEDHADAGVVGAVMRKGSTGTAVSYEEFSRSGWCERTFLKELAASAPLLKRLFSGSINYTRSYYEEHMPAVPVYAVHGALLTVRTDAFLSCGGYDEDIFLYMEEYALAARMKRAGYRTYLSSAVYEHSGSHSITGSGHGALDRQRLRAASERVYYKKYLEAGTGGMLLAGILQRVILLETALFCR